MYLHLIIFFIIIKKVCLTNLYLSNWYFVIRLLLKWVKNCEIFWYVLVYWAYIMWPKQFRPCKLPAVVGNIVVVGVLTCCALLYCVRHLKDAQMNMQHSLIWELILYKFELCHNTAESTKDIYCVKHKMSVDDSTVTGWFRKFGLGCKNLNNPYLPTPPFGQDMTQGQFLTGLNSEFSFS